MDAVARIDRDFAKQGTTPNTKRKAHTNVKLRLCMSANADGGGEHSANKTERKERSGAKKKEDTQTLRHSDTQTLTSERYDSS